MKKWIYFFKLDRTKKYMEKDIEEDKVALYANAVINEDGL